MVVRAHAVAAAAPPAITNFPELAVGVHFFNITTSVNIWRRNGSNNGADNGGKYGDGDKNLHRFH